MRLADLRVGEVYAVRRGRSGVLVRVERIGHQWDRAAGRYRERVGDPRDQWHATLRIVSDDFREVVPPVEVTVLTRHVLGLAKDVKAAAESRREQQARIEATRRRERDKWESAVERLRLLGVDARSGVPGTLYIDQAALETLLDTLSQRGET